MADTPQVSIVIPVFNEEAAINADLRTIAETMNRSGLSYEILVVDDGSTDQTVEIVKNFESVRLIRHTRNRGTGAARTTGMLAAQGNIVAMTDGDGTYPNKDIPRLVEALATCDMVIGARMRETGYWPILRVPAKTFIRLLASYLTGTKIPDLNSGFRAVKREIALRYLDILPRTHSWVSTITIAFLSDGYAVRYIPIEYMPRKGQSSFHPIRDTYNYLSLVIRSIIYFDPLKVFLPLSVALAIVGGAKLLYDIYTYHFHIAPSTLLIILTTINVFAIGMLADLIVRRLK
jgi:glycosyltransferase involved in cell wall biosynthesis